MDGKVRNTFAEAGNTFGVIYINRNIFVISIALQMYFHHLFTYNQRSTVILGGIYVMYFYVYKLKNDLTAVPLNSR